MTTFEDFVNKNNFVINCGNKKANKLIKEQLFRQIFSNVNPSGELLYFTYILSESLDICDEIVNTSKNINFSNDDNKMNDCNKFHIGGGLGLQNEDGIGNNCEQLKNKINFLLKKSNLDNKIIIDDAFEANYMRTSGFCIGIYESCGFNISSKK